MAMCSQEQAQNVWVKNKRLKRIKERMKATQGKKGAVLLILLPININRAVGT